MNTIRREIMALLSEGEYGAKNISNNSSSFSTSLSSVIYSLSGNAAFWFSVKDAIGALHGTGATHTLSGAGERSTATYCPSSNGVTRALEIPSSLNASSARSEMTSLRS